MHDPADSKKKGRPPKRVQYQVFLDLSQHTEDDYWKQLLVSASVGKFPRHITYKDERLVYRRAKVVSELSVSSDANTLEDFNRVVGFCKSLGFSSVLEDELNQQRADEQQRLQQMCTYDSWKDVKRQQTKTILLQSFIDQLCQEHNLSTREYQLLQSTISLASLFKYISANTVKMKDGKISELVGLQINGVVRGKRSFSLPIVTGSGFDSASPALTFRDEEVVDQTKLLATNWRKYCEDLHRRELFYRSLALTDRS